MAPAQHLNLLDTRLLPRAVPCSALQALAVAVGVGVATAGIAWALQDAAARAQAAPAVAPPRPALALVASDLQAQQAELAQLQAFETAQQRVLDALHRSGSGAGASGAYSEVFHALARQAGGALWITGFAIAESGGAIDLEGRMLDAAALPAYLRRLNGEAAFAGRPFAQLQIDAVDGGAAASGSTRVAAFALRSQPPAAGAAPGAAR